MVFVEVAHVIHAGVAFGDEGHQTIRARYVVFVFDDGAAYHPLIEAADIDGFIGRRSFGQAIAARVIGEGVVDGAGGACHRVRTGTERIGVIADIGFIGEIADVVVGIGLDGDATATY